MIDNDIFTDPAEVQSDLMLLEGVRWSRMVFVDRICHESADQDEAVLSMLRAESAYQLSELYYLLRARRLETVDHLRTLAETHNQYIVDLTKNEAKMGRLGLNAERALDAMFTADTMPRLLQNWRDKPGAIDQSNLARLLVAVMSTETCRKLVVACEKARFLQRDKSPYGSIIVISNGALERIFGTCIRDLRQRLEKDRIVATRL